MRKFLVIDPDTTSYEAFKNELKFDNHNILRASNGADALEFIENFLLDCVIVDLNVAYVTGLEIIDLLQKWGTRRPWIIATCLKNNPDMDYPKLDLATSIGADEILVKPYSMEQLLEQLPSSLFESHKQCIEAPIDHKHQKHYLVQAGINY